MDKRKRPRSKETKKKISLALKGRKGSMEGKKFSKEHKKALSKSHKGQVPWNRGNHQLKKTKKCECGKQIHFTSIKCGSCAQKGRTVTWGSKISASLKTSLAFKKSLKKLHLLNKNRIPWNKGKKTGPVSEEVRLNMIKGQLGRVGGRMKGKKHSLETKKKMSLVSKGRVHSKEMRRKMHLAMKGRIPKNLFSNISRNNSPMQDKLYDIVKLYFKNVKYNHFVKTKTWRFLDVAVPKLMLDFEYNGKIHLMKSNQIKDKIRTKELERLGWKVIVIDRNNWSSVHDIVKSEVHN